jgi:hypothetical protein
MPRPKKADPEKFCLACGARLERKYFNGRLEDLGAFKRRKYCNQGCMAQVFVKDVPSRSALLKRVDKYRGNSCEICGGTKNIHKHHIDGNLLNDSPENIQTLCGSCHITHHHRVRRAGQTVPGRMVSQG